MAELKMEDPLISKIYETYEKERENKPRSYLGGSAIGDECERKLWLEFRQVKNVFFEGRMLRLFQTGHREEDRMIEDLRRVGVTVYEKDNNTGKQWGVDACGKHFQGHFDGVCLNLPRDPKEWHLLEAKTHNKTKFNQLKKYGVKDKFYKHYAQMQTYMGLSDLKWALYIAHCKDDDRLYVEYIEFDEKEFKGLMAKADRVIFSDKILPRVNEKEDFFLCKFCDFKYLCNRTEFPENVTCRTCANSTPKRKGGWECSVTGECWEKESKICGEHLFNPDLITCAKAIDSGDGYVKYEMSDGRIFCNCSESGFPADDISAYTSEEISNAIPEMMCDHTMDKVRVALDGKIEEVKKL